MTEPYAPKPGQPGRPNCYVPVDGVLMHKRWVNPDGTRKTGIELEKEKVRVELETLALKLLALCKRI